MKRTENLIAIEEAYQEGKNLLVNASPGTGKTTTALHLANLCDNRSLFVSFSNKVQKEIEDKISKMGASHKIMAITLHSMGMKTLIRRTGKKIVLKKGKSKSFSMVMDLQGKFPDFFKRLNFKSKFAITFDLIALENASRIYYSKNYDHCKEMANEMGDAINAKDRVLKPLFESLLELRDEKNSTGKVLEIDYTDMIFLPVYLDLDIPFKPYSLFIDECQDLSYIEFLLTKKIIDQPQLNNFVAVGDDNQSIFLFSGADSNSFNRFLEIEGTVELPLRVCFRCPPRIIEEVHQIYDIGLKSSDPEKEGHVFRSKDTRDISPGSLVVCRNFDPLLSLFFELRRMNKNVYIDLNDYINPVIQFVRKNKKNNLNQVLSTLSQQIDTDTKVLKRSPTNTDARLRLRKNESIYLVLSTLRVEEVISDSDHSEEIIFKINQLKKIENKDNCIILMTIHKSKGLENSDVYILNENLIPSKYAKSKEQLRQEQNLRFVARSRSSKNLTYLNVKV